MKTTTFKVEIAGLTEFRQPASVETFEPDQDLPYYAGPHLLEFAGRACYQSWGKPNPETATNLGYIRHILEVGHLSVLEHGSVSFYLSGVSRSFTHELVRHRHLSFSQLSQRYVNESDAAMVLPEVIDNDTDMTEVFKFAAVAAQQAYNKLVELLQLRYAAVPDKTLRRKMARQAARAVLPNATETRIVVTGNYRAWRHFINLRATEHADLEIRTVAIEILRQLQENVPNVFADYEIKVVDLGQGEIAWSPYVETP